MQKTVILLRGVSGSGKSTIAKILYDGFYTQIPLISCEIVSADNYKGYYDNKDGVYTWSDKTCKEAHAYCFAEFKKFVDGGVDFVIVDNTNLSLSAYNKYAEYGISKGYELKIIAIEPIWDDLPKYVGRNRHGLDLGKITQQYERFYK